MNNFDSLTVSAPRGKTPSCQCCGGKIENRLEAVRVSIPHQRNGVYAHSGCLRTLGYHEPAPEWFEVYREKHLTETARITLTPEVEGFRILHGLTTREHNLYMFAEYGLLASEDCTVGVEYKAGISVNLHGIGQWFEGVERMVNMRDSRAGLHLNTGWYGMRGQDITAIYNSRYTLLAPLMEYMEKNDDTTVKIWGRSFNRWAEADMACVHGSWVNLENRSDGGQYNARIEWRLPHYRDAKQAKQCACMVADFTAILRSFCEGTRSAKQAGALIVKHYKQAERGEAVWQRPERNK